VRLGQRVITQSHVGLYRLFGGGVFAHLGPAPVLLLTTTGRRTGKKRTTPLIYVPADELGLVASNSGAKSDPFWYRNLLANPHATVTLGRKTWSVVAEAAEGERRREIWREAVRLYPAYADYQESTSRQLPVLVLRQVSREP
jgi:deazaflavin-dependent oxidoreductase (nitroreductase family)